MSLPAQDLTQITNTELQNLAEKVCRKGLATPTLFLMEMYKPLTGVLAAVSQSLYPLVFPVFHGQDLKTLLKLLEDRELLEKFLCILEQEALNPIEYK